MRVKGHAVLSSSEGSRAGLEGRNGGVKCLFPAATVCRDRGVFVLKKHKG